LQQGSETRFLAKGCGFFALQRVSGAPSCPFKQVKNLVSSKVSGSKIGERVTERMPVTYTNRKGDTYYLCRGTTRAGKPHYYFAREPKGEPVEQIPEGFKIGESANGFVFLRKDRPAQILPEEVAAVEAAVGRHPQPRHYRVEVKHDRIEIHEQVGPDGEELIAALTQQGRRMPGLADRIRATTEGRARFAPVLRFVLANAKRRTFRAERRYYPGGTENWVKVGPMGTVDRLARHWIPRLGTEQFFELF
jgi:hypothetical protein